MELTRRTLIGAGLTGAAASLAGLPSISNAFTPILSKKGPVKNIIFCVSDGMPVQIMSVVNSMRLWSEGRPSYWAWLMQQPGVATAIHDSSCLSTVVTDSAAASSAWGSGRRVWSGQLNEFPDGTKLKTLTQIFKPAGIACGLVTTSTITHATPAGFAVNVPLRGLEHLIAEQYLEQDLDVLMGGGNRSFNPESREDGLDLYAKYAESGYTVAKNRSELMGATSDKVLGVFSNSHVPYTIDHLNSEELTMTVPTLAEMTKVAIDKLKGSSEGFLLQVEGARVDHAGHANDIGGMVFDQIAFEDAVQVAVEYAMEDQETLVVVTSDHGCGGFSLNGAGSGYEASTEQMHSIARMKASFSALLPRISDDPSPGAISDLLEDQLGIEVSSSEAGAISRAAGGESPFGDSNFFRSLSATLGMIVGNHTASTWTSGNHTAEHMLVTSYGPAADQFSGFFLNTDMFDKILAAKGMSHSNPTMTREQAAAHREAFRVDPELVARYGVEDEEHAFSTTKESVLA